MIDISCILKKINDHFIWDFTLATCYPDHIATCINCDNMKEGLNL